MHKFQIIRSDVAPRNNSSLHLEEVVNPTELEIPEWFFVISVFCG